MSSCVATTLHFMYPVVTAVVMMTFYHEARRLSTVLAIVMAVAGVGILSWDPTGQTSLRGVVIVLISAVCYALYLIRVNRSRAAHMESLKLVFYIMFIGAFIFLAEALRQNTFQPIANALQLGNLAALALICTIVTNVCLVVSVKRIGSTMTAVIGALVIPAVVIIIWTRRR